MKRSCLQRTRRPYAEPRRFPPCPGLGCRSGQLEPFRRNVDCSEARGGCRSGVDLDHGEVRLINTLVRNEFGCIPTKSQNHASQQYVEAVLHSSPTGPSVSVRDDNYGTSQWGVKTCGTGRKRCVRGCERVSDKARNKRLCLCAYGVFEGLRSVYTGLFCQAGSFLSKKGGS